MAAGQLDLDEDVNGRLESWRVPDHPYGYEAVTPRRILAHGAGFPSVPFQGYGPDAELPGLAQVLDGEPPASSAPVRVVREPGSEYSYSGAGYCVLQQLLIDVAGKEFPELARELVLEPAGMRRSTFLQPPPEAWRDELASGHDPEGYRLFDRWRLHPEMAAAGLATTASDLARFALALARSWRGDEGAMLPGPLAREMLEPQLAPWYGLGLGVHGEGEELSFQHGGATYGFQAWLACFPATGQGAAILTNGHEGAAILADLVPYLAETLGWPASPPLPG